MYRWVDHTAEVELAIEAPTEAAVFEDALAAFAELLAGEEGDGAAGSAVAGERVAREVTIDAPDRATLLAEWIAELAFLAETEGLVPARAARLELDGDGRLDAVVEGHRGDPPHIVKAVTYHRLAFEPAPGGGYRATVVLDV